MSVFRRPEPDDVPSLLTLIEQRRSVRRYTGRPVDRAILDRLCEAARWAPSNWNGQPSRFVIVDDAGTIARVYALLIERTAEVERGIDGDPRLTRFVGHCRRYFEVIRDCTVLVAACYKPSGQFLEESLAEHFEGPRGVSAWSPNLLSLGMAVQNLLLVAHELGLGACFHSGPVAFLRGPLHRLLDLPPRLELAGLVTLGWPEADAAPCVGTRRPRDHIRRYVTGSEG